MQEYINTAQTMLNADINTCKEHNKPVPWIPLEAQMNHKAFFSEYGALGGAMILSAYAKLRNKFGGGTK